MRLRTAWLLLPIVLACDSTPRPASYDGVYVSPGAGVLELHKGHDGALRGYLRTATRVAALAPIEIRSDTLYATLTDVDSARSELRTTVNRGPAIVVDGQEYRRTAVESPASPEIRREIEAVYAALGKAVGDKDYDAFQALRVEHFATIPPDGFPRTGAQMANRARGMLERIQPPIQNTNDILELTVRGDDAIATVRQKFTRMQVIQGEPHEIHTEVTQRETWTRTPAGWKLLFVDEVRDHMTLDNGRRVN